MPACRNALLAGAAFVAMTCFSSPESHAQLVCANCYEEVTGVLHDLKEVAQLIAEYDELVMVYNSVAHAVDAAAASPSLLAGTLRNPLSGLNLQNAGTGMGFGGLSGFGPVAGLANTTWQNQLVFQAHGNDMSGVVMNQRMQSLAGMQATQLQLMQSAQQRLLYIGELESSITGSSDVQATSAVAGRIANEEHIVQTQLQQVQQIAATAQMQGDVERAQYTQKQRADAENFAASLPSVSGGGGPGGAPTFTGNLVGSNAPIVPAFGGGG